MSRSKHTDPLDIRAERRLRGPRTKRGAGDLGGRRAVAKRLKELGVAVVPASRSAQGERRAWPRILVQLPQDGFHHPASKQDILRAMEAIGPGGVYGLRVIELARAPRTRPPGVPALGRYFVPGRIRLYEQPQPPWRLAGLLKPSSLRRLQQAGATVTLMAATGMTLVHWPANALRRFMVEEVLLHELGHHVLQHNKGKRSVRTARTRDHEAFAAAFVRHNLVRIRKAARAGVRTALSARRGNISLGGQGCPRSVRRPDSAK